MSASFSYSVTTKVPRERVWSLLTDITNWPKFSDIYSDLHWSGTPWEIGSAIVPPGLHSSERTLESKGQYPRANRRA